MIDDSFDKIGLAPPLRQKILTLMSQPHRFYHTTDHVLDILSLYSGNDPNIIAAAWFHDIVFNPLKAAQRKANHLIWVDGHDWLTDEKLSALFAEKCLVGNHIVDAKIVSSIIMDTEKHRPDNDISQLFSDLDMSIVGADRAKYQKYAANIRKEFAHVSDLDFINGRRSFLKTVDKSAIYYTVEFSSSREEQAHENIRWEIDHLDHIAQGFIEW